MKRDERPVATPTVESSEALERARVDRLRQVAMLGGVVIYTAQGAAFLAFDVWILMWLSLGAVALHVASILLVRRGRSLAGLWLVAIFAGIYVPALTVVLGPDGGYPFIFLLSAANVAVVMSRHQRVELVVALALTVVSLPASVAAAWQFGPLLVIPDGALSVVYYLNAITSLLGVIATTLYFMVAQGRARHEILGLRKQVSDALQLGQYTVVSKLGEGGMGTVYRARHAMLRRPTAIKLLRPGAAGTESLERFEREVQRTAELTHPNTVTVFDYGHTADGIFYYVMELLDGANLGDIVALTGPLPPARVAHVLRQVLGALVEAHGVGLIHRDIKPANIMLCTQGGLADFAKVLDFGLVKEIGGSAAEQLTRPDIVAGTPQYLPPEAVTSPGSQDERSDLYALGAVAYFMLTGTHLFSGATVMEVCLHHVQTPPEPASERLGRALPPDLESLVMACLNKAPEQRPRTARELLRMLTACDGLDRWDGTEWWEEYGDLLRTRKDEAKLTPTAFAIDLDEQRTG